MNPIKPVKNRWRSPPCSIAELRDFANAKYGNLIQVGRVARVFFKHKACPSTCAQQGAFG